ncbi:hypothetical protein L4D77_06155 [Photobacterium frigidiphilum]|uniref:hypothetical protein n=1 Tax=Photobacterium frigidiphilum TaxID=264736 RepID=UPI003D0CB795
MKFDLSQKSTKTGLILLGSAVVGVATGNAELATVALSESGAQVGGMIPAIAGMFIGLWDMFREEKK